MSRSPKAFLWASIALLFACTPSDPIGIDDPYLHPPVAGRDVAVAYFELANRSASDIALDAVTSERVRAIEIHTHIHDGEMLRMRRLPSVPVPAGSTVRFEPGGHHLMLFGYAAGETGAVPMTLHFSNGETRSVEFAVQPRGEHR